MYGCDALTPSSVVSAEEANPMHFQKAEENETSTSKWGTELLLLELLTLTFDSLQLRDASGTKMAEEFKQNVHTPGHTLKSWSKPC